MERISFFFSLAAVIFFQNSFSQNYLANSSFEIISSAPTDQAQFGNTKFWSDNEHTGTEQAQTIFFHSPDLYTSSSVFSSNPVTPNPALPTSAHSGSNFVGMQPYELIQQSFDASNFQDGQSYTFSAWIWLANDDPSWWNNLAINVFLAENTVKYTDYSIWSGLGGSGYQWQLCNDNYVSYDFSNNQVLQLGQQNLSLADYPNGKWHQIAFMFNAPASPHTNLYNHVVIDLVHPGYGLPTNPCSNSNVIPPCSICEGGYMFIDDVTIKPSLHCDSYCTNKIDGITIDSNGGGFQTGWEAGCVPFAPDIKNAIGINLTVIERNQSVIKGRESAFNINGLQDVGYPDYEFTFFGSTSLPVDAYVFELEVYNCYEDLFFYPVVNNIGSACGGIPEDNVHNGVEVDCCPQNLFYENVTFTASEYDGADQNIFIGNNSSGTLGPVIISNGSDVRFSAGQGITVDPGELTVQPNSRAQFIIQPCVQARMAAPAPRTRYNNSTKKDSILSYNQDTIHTLDKFKRMDVHPNPSNGIVNLTYNREDYTIDTFDIYCSDGQKILSIPGNINNKLDLTSLSNGVYYIKPISAGKPFEIKKIVVLK
jgi:hypothetical protein